MSYTWLQELKSDDKVIVDRGYGADTDCVKTVKRTTKTLIVLNDNSRYRKQKRKTMLKFFTDENGNTDGGVTQDVGFTISWQRGPLRVGEELIPQNGAFVEDVIQAALDRLVYYQTTKFKCSENQHAITSLRDALAFLKSRTTRRKEEGFEGTHEV